MLEKLRHFDRFGDFIVGTDGVDLPAQEPTQWALGSVQEVAWVGDLGLRRVPRWMVSICRFELDVSFWFP